MRILIVFGLVGLLFGCGGEGEESASEMGGNVSGQTTKVKKNIMKLKATGSCVKCTLTGADLNGANLKEADLEGAYLRDADLSDAYLWGADLVETKVIQMGKRLGFQLGRRRSKFSKQDFQALAVVKEDC